MSVAEVYIFEIATIPTCEVSMYRVCYQYIHTYICRDNEISGSCDLFVSYTIDIAIYKNCSKRTKQL